MMDAFFGKWLEYFEWNSEEPDTLPWQAHESLTKAEMRCIRRSIAAFRLGENSEGTALRAFARVYGERMGFPLLPKITALFVEEERRHSILLAGFMERHGIPAIHSDWTDTIFRRIRKPFGFKTSLSVLITAEIISLVYYRALREATGSRLLKAICGKIIEDEKAHVEYESALIRFAQDEGGAWERQAWRMAQRILFEGTVAVVYREHRSVLWGGGYGFARFHADCWAEFGICFPADADAGARTLERCR